MLLENRQKTKDGQSSDQPTIAMSFHSHRLKYYGVVYLLIIFILFLNFGE